MQFRMLHWESYTPLVEISKLKHMWSFFGRSYNYNLFIGLVEFLIGGLILFNRTRLIGLLLALGLCINILILNIEFDVYFAVWHIAEDLIIVLILLLGYRKDVYKFFIELGGRMNKPMTQPKTKFSRLFPYFFLVTLSVSYFLFSFHTKSKYIVDEDVTGSFKIQSIRINDSIIDLGKGKIGNEPMMFIEHNNQFVLSIEDTLYMGKYILDDKKITIYLDSPTNFGMTSLIGGSFDNNSIKGKINENRSLDLIYERIDGKKDYLNDLYK